MLTGLTFACKLKNPNTGKASIEHSSRQALDWAGTYMGTLPCADCEGIQNTLVLDTNNTYSQTLRYLGKGESVYREKGKFTWTSDGQNIVLHPSGKESSTYYAVGENFVRQLDSSQQTIKGALSERFVLSKKASEVYERYWKLSELKAKPIVVDSTFSAEPHLIFKAHNQRLIGSLGCNALTASFTLFGKDKIEILAGASTLKACQNGSLEKDFNAALLQADSYWVDADTLRLYNSSKQQLAKFVSVLLR
jgi:uncharacterized lipoprotein NlpE involved in copper resistance